MDDLTPPDTAEMRDAAIVFYASQGEHCANLLNAAGDWIDAALAAAGEPQPATDGALAELRKLSDEASTGTWRPSGDMVLHAPYGDDAIPISLGRVTRRADAQFIAAAVNYVRSVLAAGAAPSTPQNEPTECRAESGAGFMCTLAAGHHGGHVAVQDDGGECDRWDR